MGSTVPSNPQKAPKTHGRRPPPPPPHRSSGKGVCDMSVPRLAFLIVAELLASLFRKGRR